MSVTYSVDPRCPCPHGVWGCAMAHSGGSGSSRPIAATLAKADGGPPSGRGGGGKVVHQCGQCISFAQNAIRHSSKLSIKKKQKTHESKMLYLCQVQTTGLRAVRPPVEFIQLYMTRCPVIVSLFVCIFFFSSNYMTNWLRTWPITRRILKPVWFPNIYTHTHKTTSYQRMIPQVMFTHTPETD